MIKIPLAILSIALNANTKTSALDDLDALVNRLNKDVAIAPQTWSAGWPGSSALTPTGFGGTRGMAAFGLGLQPRIRYRSSGGDGVFGVILPVGDPVKEVGVDLVGTFTDLSDISDRGWFDVIVHKRFQDASVAIGSERLTNYGISDVDRTFYIVGSQMFRLKPSNLEPFSRMTVSLGLGNGRFRREADVFRDRKTVNPFGSVSVNVIRPLSVFTEWSGQDLDAGISFAPFHDIPVTVTAAAVDMTGSAGDGIRASFGVGYVLRFH